MGAMHQTNNLMSCELACKNQREVGVQNPLLGNQTLLLKYIHRFYDIIDTRGPTSWCN